MKQASESLHTTWKNNVGTNQVDISEEEKD